MYWIYVSITFIFFLSERGTKKTYLANHPHQIPIQHRIRKICNQPKTLGLSCIQRSLGISHHVLLQHSPDISPCVLILREDILAPSETTLFSGIPVEFNRVLEKAVGARKGGVGKQYAQGLEEKHGAAAVVIDAGGAAGEAVGGVDGVKVGAYDDGAVGAALDASND